MSVLEFNYEINGTSMSVLEAFYEKFGTVYLVNMRYLELNMSELEQFMRNVEKKIAFHFEL